MVDRIYRKARHVALVAETEIKLILLEVSTHRAVGVAHRIEREGDRPERRVLELTSAGHQLLDPSLCRLRSSRDVAYIGRARVQRSPTRQGDDAQETDTHPHSRSHSSLL